MICFDMPLFIVVVFLFLTLVIGIYFSRKKTNFREYAVGNKDFATATLVATVLATLYGGGGLVRTVEQVHHNGLWWIIIFLLSGCFGPWVIRPLALRMGPFMQHLSMAETIGSVYGRYPRVVVALSNVCVSIISLVTQITVTSKAISMCVDSFDSDMITVLATLILVSYSTLGGIRSVTFTDVIQFMTFSTIIPLLTWYMFREANIPVCEMASFLKVQPKFQFSTVFHFDTKLVAMVALLLSGLASYVQPHVMQRVYMSSDPIQARRVFLYSGLFGFCIRASILLIGLFVFVGAPELSVKEVWGYVMAHVPSIFKGLLAISLLAMSMSTSDSRLNVCAVMVSHDILESLRGTKAIACSYRLRVAKITSLTTGLLAMVVAFHYTNLLKLMYWTLDFSVPVTIAPFLLAIFGFRGTARTALIGMVTGAVSILAWNKWVEPVSNINGAFICMLVNGLAMVIAHYLFKQPEGTGWVGPDNALMQVQQLNARKQRARKEAIKNGFIDIKDTLAKLKPSHTTLTCLGLYVVVSDVLTYFIASITDHGWWLITQLLVGVCFLGYSTFVSEKRKPIPDWLVGLFWVMGLSFCFPINVVWHWWHGTNLFLTLGLSLAHLVVTLLVLPLYLGISFLGVTLLMAIYLSTVYATKPLIFVLSPSGVALLLLLCLALGLFIFGIFVYLKVKSNRYLDQVAYLKDRERLSTSRKLKESLYDSAMLSSAGTPSNSSILAQVVRKIEESISFLDSNMPLYKQDFQSIINKLYDWVVYFNKREKAKHHALLQPTKITLDKLIRKVEVALSQEVADPPRLLLEKINNPNGERASYIICDIHQVVYALVHAVLRVGDKVMGGIAPMVGIQFHQTALQFKQVDVIDDNYASSMVFEAIALVVRNVSVPSDRLPKVKDRYDDEIDGMGPQGKPGAPPSIDLQQETISSIVGAHYGYLAYVTEKAVLLVLPVDCTAIRAKMTAKLPLDCLTSETPVTPKEQADSMMALMQFHDYVCKSSHPSDPIDVGTISNLLLLLRQHFGFKRHASGQLFYVRAVGIAQLVVEWVFHSPKVIYAALLYELVRHTRLPLSYVKEHYNLGVYAFVLNVVGVDKRQDLDHPSLLYVQNRLKEAIKEDHVQLSVLFIKLAERLYDLRHAAGYAYLPEIAHMAQETLAIDVQIAGTYLGPEIGAALEKAAKQALEVCKNKDKEQHYKEKK